MSLTDGQAVSWETRTGVQPSMTGEEIEACEALLKADPRRQAALRKRAGHRPDAEPVLVPERQRLRVAGSKEEAADARDPLHSWEPSPRGA